jgi:hypothetical protein
MTQPLFSEAEAEQFFDWLRERLPKPRRIEPPPPDPAWMESLWQQRQARRPASPFHGASGPEVWLEAAADGNNLDTTEPTAVEDEFGTRFLLTLETLTGNESFQMLRLKIPDPARWERYEGRTVEVTVGETGFSMTFEDDGQAGIRIPAVKQRTCFTVRTQTHD